MDTQTQGHRDYGFVIGLVTGTFVGAGLAMWLAPRAAAELGERISDSAKTLGRQASERVQQANSHVVEAVGELTRTSQGVRDDVAEAVARGAREVERFATASSSQSR
jgi:gas vesicle protein